ncbi:MAG: class II aldolase/adducin family protein [Candidatus Margulisiibacteriota bacterium]|jgi:ribulose-5-phosphate 4-epimerase/fuculose-1-phosphate aldolase
MSEVITGAELTKFKTVFLSDQIPNDQRIHELSEWLKKLSQAGVLPDYGTGAFGNLSFRLTNCSDIAGNAATLGFVITASGLKVASPENFVTVQKGDFVSFSVEVEGTRKPSSESLLHLAIYQARPEINAIFHGHNDNLLLEAENLGLPCTAKEEAFGSLELIERVLEIIDQHDFLIMKNHGFISLGKDLDGAGEQIFKFLEKLDRR